MGACQYRLRALGRTNVARMSAAGTKAFATHSAAERSTSCEAAPHDDDRQSQTRVPRWSPRAGCQPHVQKCSRRSPHFRSGCSVKRARLVLQGGLAPVPCLRASTCPFARGVCVYIVNIPARLSPASDPGLTTAKCMRLIANQWPVQKRNCARGCIHVCWSVLRGTRTLAARRVFLSLLVSLLNAECVANM